MSCFYHSRYMRNIKLEHEIVLISSSKLYSIQDKMNIMQKNNLPKIISGQITYRNYDFTKKDRDTSCKKEY